MNTLQLTSNILLGAVVFRALVFILNMLTSRKKEVEKYEGELNLSKKKEKTTDADLQIFPLLVGIVFLSIFLIGIFK